MIDTMSQGLASWKCDEIREHNKFWNLINISCDLEITSDTDAGLHITTTHQGRELQNQNQIS